MHHAPTFHDYRCLPQVVTSPAATHAVQRRPRYRTREASLPPGDEIKVTEAGRQSGPFRRGLWKFRSRSPGEREVDVGLRGR